MAGLQTRHHGPERNGEHLRTGYFNAIKVAKNQHWSSFLLSATLQNLWTAKWFTAGQAPPRFPSLPGAETPQQMNEALLGHFLPPNAPFPPPPPG